MIRMVVVAAVVLAIGTSSAVAGIMLSHAALSRNVTLEFRKAGDDLQKLRPPVLKIMNAGTWSAWWHS